MRTACLCRQAYVADRAQVAGEIRRSVEPGRRVTRTTGSFSWGCGDLASRQAGLMPDDRAASAQVADQNDVSEKHGDGCASDGDGGDPAAQIFLIGDALFGCGCPTTLTSFELAGLSPEKRSTDRKVQGRLTFSRRRHCAPGRASCIWSSGGTVSVRLVRDIGRNELPGVLRSLKDKASLSFAWTECPFRRGGSVP